MRRLAFLAAMTGCGFDKNLASTDGARPEANDPCNAWSFRPKDFDPCMIAPPADPPQLFTGTYIINSDNGMMTGAGGPFQLPYAMTDSIGIVSLTGLVLQQTVTIRTQGIRSLVIASWGSIQLDGNIDASSNRSQTAAGANPASCGASAGVAGTTRTNGDGGAGGGGGAAPGGIGGKGDNGAAAGGPAGVLRAMPATIEGGCPGGSTPSADLGTAGAPGSGGGGVAIVARETLAVSGIVHVGGSGGGGASQNQNAGGGGGAGGMIRLEAQTLTFGGTAILASNGGQGGGGCDGAAATPGVSGLAGAGRAFMSNNQGNGGDGGAGSWRDSPIGDPGFQGTSGGGGGGGGVGYITYKGHVMMTGTPLTSPTNVAF